MLKQIKTQAAGNLARVQALSPARLRNYRRFFGAADDAQALGLYQWNEELSALLFRTISMVEVVLRNRFHTAFSLRYGAIGAQGSKDWYDHVAIDKKSQIKIKEIQEKKKKGRARAHVPSPDDVISGLTFGFWPSLLNLKTDQHSQPVDWGPIMLDALPGHRDRLVTQWAKLKNRDALFARLDLCNGLRNRVAHHEPIWKLGPLMQEVRARKGVVPSVELPAPKDPAEALARLRLLYGRVTELLGWLSPEMAAQHLTSELHFRCLSLLSLEALAAYQHALPPAEIDLANVRNMRDLRKTMRYASRRQQPVLLKVGTRTIGHLNSLTLQPK